MQAQHKRCTKCGVEKPVGEFYRQKDCTGGYRPDCKSCCRAAMKARRDANLEVAREKDRARHERDGDKRRASSRAYYAANREAGKQSRRAYYTANREKFQALAKRYREENRDKDRAHGAVERAVKRGDLTPESCLFCGATRVEAHHHDYSLPLDVTWLCRSHHALAHRIVPAHGG